MQIHAPIGGPWTGVAQRERKTENLPLVAAVARFRWLNW